MEYVVRDAQLADGRERDVLVRDGRIDDVAHSVTAETVVPASGKLLLPGMIDAHVHCREPGAAHKETWRTATRSAAAGGVTTVVDQPNTDPPTIDGASFETKAVLARQAMVDYGINGGVTEGWDPGSLFERPVFALGEVFLADSTGDMGISVDRFRTAARKAATADLRLTVHAEDADRFDPSALPDDGPVGRDAPADAWSQYRPATAELAAVETAIEAAADTGVDAHIAHASTPEGVDSAAAAGLTCEVTPHHLFLSRDDLADLGTYGRMNPPLRSERRRAALFDRAADPAGPVDIVATDHAPHSVAEKEAPLTDAPSGVPGVETALPLLLAAAARGSMTYEQVRDLTAANPAAIFDLPEKGRIEPGRDADLVLVDTDDVETIEADNLHSKCGWTPFEGFDGIFPEWIAVRGRIVHAAMDATLPPPLTVKEISGHNVRLA